MFGFNKSILKSPQMKLVFGVVFVNSSSIMLLNILCLILVFFIHN